ncbi:MAG: hypothetical protein WC860_08805 [Candidatus Margulisiibacteriota bacterium]|jgi:DNA polymerase III delta prime subunit
MQNINQLINPKYQDIFKKIIINKTATHSYIFAGCLGSFIKNTAQDFIKSLNCLNFINKPCGECKNCLNFDQRKMINYYTIEPEGKITINLVRELQDFIKYGPIESSFLTVLINNAHLFTEEAANAFLKTLEEPLPRTVFILLTPNLLELLPTIRSRSQIFEFPIINDQDVASYINQLPNNEKENMLLKLNQNLELLKYYLDDPTLISDLNYLSFQEFNKKNNFEKLSLAYDLSSKKKEQIKLFLILWLKELLEQNYGSLKNQRLIIEKIIENISQMKYNLNLRLNLENLFIQISH